MSYKILVPFFVVLVVLVCVGIYAHMRTIVTRQQAITVTDDGSSLHAPSIGSTTETNVIKEPLPLHSTGAAFIDDFMKIYTVTEAGSIDENTNANWWLSSGAYLYSASGTANTVQGSLPSSNRWRIAYAHSNPIDTDNGYHPQNIFRFVTLRVWDNFTQQVHFLIKNDNFSSSPNRNASNGLLLFNRYQFGGQTLYYTGIRVDGTAVIKKKYKGVYYTMAQKVIFPGTYTGYIDDVNLLPHEVWIGLRAVTVTNEDGSVTVTLYIENPEKTIWTKLLQSTDTGQYDGTPPIVGANHAGIRTDFMDVEFSDYSIKPI